MQLVTTETIAGKTIAESLGLIRASVVRSRHIGSDIGAGLKSIVGGKLGGYEKLLRDGREEALTNLAKEAAKLGADAVVATRMETSNVMQGAIEVMAYGTAVKLR